MVHLGDYIYEACNYECLICAFTNLLCSTLKVTVSSLGHVAQNTELIYYEYVS